jgi:hypothetical protein
MRRKLLLLAFIVAATAVNSFTAPRPAEALVCNKTCCGINDCSCCHLGCQCPAPNHHA